MVLLCAYSSLHYACHSCSLPVHTAIALLRCEFCFLPLRLTGSHAGSLVVHSCFVPLLSSNSKFASCLSLFLFMLSHDQMPSIVLTLTALRHAYVTSSNRLVPTVHYLYNQKFQCVSVELALTYFPYFPHYFACCLPFFRLQINLAKDNSMLH